MDKLNKIVEQYYSAHQISKSVNILDIATQNSDNKVKINITQCVCNYLEPKNGWGKSVVATNSKNEKCYHCIKRMQELFPDFVSKTNVAVKQCDNCYLFMCKKYVERNSPVKLTGKFIRKNKTKL